MFQKVHFSDFFNIIIIIMSTAASRCPETRKPHPTNCTLFYNCVNLPSGGYVWTPSKCSQGLMFESYLGLCVLPSDTWVCGTQTEATVIKKEESVTSYSDYSSEALDFSETVDSFYSLDTFSTKEINPTTHLSNQEFDANKSLVNKLENSTDTIIIKQTILPQVENKTVVNNVIWFGQIVTNLLIYQTMKSLLDDTLQNSRLSESNAKNSENRENILSNNFVTNYIIRNNFAVENQEMKKKERKNEVKANKENNEENTNEENANEENANEKNTNEKNTKVKKKNTNEGNINEESTIEENTNEKKAKKEIKTKRNRNRTSYETFEDTMSEIKTEPVTYSFNQPVNNQSIIEIKNFLGEKQYLTIERYEFLKDQLKLESTNIIPCSSEIRLPDNNNCTKYYTCDAKFATLQEFSCPSRTAFNKKTKLCDAQTYTLCRMKEFPTNFQNAPNKNLFKNNLCKTTGKFADQNSPSHYYLCYYDNEKTTNLSFVRMMCPKNRIFCAEKKICTRKRLCTKRLSER